MPFLFALVSINILSFSMVWLLVSCGKKENENNGANPTEIPKKKETQNQSLAFSTVEKSQKRSDIYHEVAENLAFPASARCKNHDDAWRILALYLDYIRAVNPVEFEQFRMLDSALAVLHDFSFIGRTAQVSNETLALAVLYFLVDFHKIKINLGSATQPWYSILCKNAKIEELETMKQWMEQDLIGMKSDDFSNGSSLLEEVH
ncbi:hypothetical protein L5515_010266 [Caenorhabditis briggsae]|uniref:Uncharacterized protein n=1 Tax=Caenorhabditis briggsae TaxID=6238 RepID=A0AAE9JCY9_CAEBR|nr:hypothetical protein L5515_010266 [Caenorhabditis briggsae]